MKMIRQISIALVWCSLLSSIAVVANQVKSTVDMSYEDMDVIEKGHHHKNLFCFPVPKDDSARMIESGYGVDPKGHSLVGKNVLIIGGSRGIGRATAFAFEAAGANVICTSRHPQCYLNPACYTDPSCTGDQCSNTQNGVPASPGLSAVPLELASEESIENFFRCAILPVWDHIDILVLGGLKLEFGSIINSKASDLFEFLNVQLLGFQRVVNHATKLIADIKHSRIIVLTSAASIVPIPFFGAGYTLAKAALVRWVIQWNFERLLFKELSGGKSYYKTVAISMEGSFTQGDSQNTLPVTYESGVCCSWDPSSNAATLGIVANELNTSLNGMPASRAAEAILWMASTRHPEWRYGVFGEDETFCVDPKCKPISARNFSSKFNAYKVKQPVTEWIKSRPWITIAKHPFESTWYDCVAPTDQKPAIKLPRLLDNACCPDPERQTRRHTRFEYVEDLVCNPCKRLPYDTDFTSYFGTPCPIEDCA
ncbi:MAG: SDR family NAD(P)-dependent oxidoreductase [Candidatus Babeliales bacterium]